MDVEIQLRQECYLGGTGIWGGQDRIVDNVGPKCVAGVENIPDVL